MRSTIKLIEIMLKEKIGKANFTVRLHSSKSGNLPGRKLFTRSVYRQTSLREFMDDGIGSVAPLLLPQDIVYTVSARYMKEDKVEELLYTLVKDLNMFLYSQR